MRFYDVPVNRSVPTEANRGLTSYRSVQVKNHVNSDHNKDAENYLELSII
jgi:hypothetical protein